MSEPNRATRSPVLNLLSDRKLKYLKVAVVSAAGVVAAVFARGAGAEAEAWPQARMPTVAIRASSAIPTNSRLFL